MFKDNRKYSIYFVNDMFTYMYIYGMQRWDKVVSLSIYI